MAEIAVKTDFPRKVREIENTWIPMPDGTRLAETGAVVGLCPITEANLGDGIFPAKSWLEAGGRIWWVPKRVVREL